MGNQGTLKIYTEQRSEMLLDADRQQHRTGRDPLKDDYPESREPFPPTLTMGHELSAAPTLEVLPCIVGFFLAFRIAIVLLAVHLFGANPELGTATNVGFEFLLLTVVAFCASADQRHQGIPIRRLLAGRWVLLFVAFSCFSLLWSSTASLADSAVYWCAMASDVAMLAMLLQSRPLTSIVDSVMEGYVLGACAIAVIVWILPVQSDLRLGDEELLGPNQIGYVCGLAFFFAQYLLRQHSRRMTVSAVVLAITVLRSLSKTTIVAFLVSQGFLLLRDRSISRKSKILVCLGTLIVVASFSSLLTSYYDVYTGAGNQSETLTGRLGIWAYFLAEAVQNPWLGHGFDSAWKVIPPFGADQFQAAHAHNELLQQFYAYGVVGIFLLTGIYGSLFVQIRRMFA